MLAPHIYTNAVTKGLGFPTGRSRLPPLFTSAWRTRPRYFPGSRSSKAINISTVDWIILGAALVDLWLLRLCSRVMSAAASASESLFVDDLPSVAISRLVAEKKIACGDTRARIHLDGVTGEFSVARIDFPNGGWWAFVICHCGRRVRRLWVHNDHLCCRHCLQRRGLRYRCKGCDGGPRIAQLRARLSSPSPARLHPRPKRILDRRWRLEASLRRAEFVDRLRGLRRSVGWALDSWGRGLSDVVSHSCSTAFGSFELRQA
jgi:hypothetical protein